MVHTMNNKTNKKYHNVRSVTTLYQLQRQISYNIISVTTSDQLQHYISYNVRSVTTLYQKIRVDTEVDISKT
jgi:hypothetical protein